MARAERFEELRIWQESREIVARAYSHTGPDTPGYRDYGFRDQLRSAAISTMNNIAEGFERGSDADFARFLDMAKGSCGELRSMLYAGEDLHYIALAEAEGLRSRCRELSRGIAALAAHLRK